MAHPADVARGRDIVARWCNLAEQRLEHLTELFETGRWRRYHTELEFLENIQEAKAAVETWRDLLSREASLENTAIDMSWLGRRRNARRCRATQGTVRQVVQPKPQPAPIAATPPPSCAPRRRATFPLTFWSRCESQLVGRATRRRPCPMRRRWTKCRCTGARSRRDEGTLSAAAQRALAGRGGTRATAAPRCRRPPPARSAARLRRTGRS